MDRGSIKKHNTERGYFEIYLEGRVILAYAFKSCSRVIHALWETVVRRGPSFRNILGEGEETFCNFYII